jgi:hypothetical protein
MCICDAIVLNNIGTYTGLALIFPALQHLIAYKIFVYFTAIAWYAGSWFTVLMMAARCVHLVCTHKSSVYFSKTMLIIYTVTLYLFPALIFIYIFFFYSPLVFGFNPQFCSWIFVKGDWLADIIATVNTVGNFVCILLVTGFNVRSLYWVHKSRTQIESVAIQGASENRKREIKLVIQCVIIGVIYTVGTLFFCIVSSVRMTDSIGQYVATHFIWMFTHVQNPIIYIAFNKRLHERFLELTRKLCTPCKG